MIDLPDFATLVEEMSHDELLETAKRQGAMIMQLHMHIHALREALATIRDTGEPFAADHADDVLTRVRLP